MAQVAVMCPDCSRAFVVNGRGRCRCGSYLVHHFSGAFTLAGRTWDVSGGEPRLLSDRGAT